MKYRRIVLIIFIVLVGASLIYALMDQREVTTSSEKAYQAFLKGKDYQYRLYNRDALEEYEKAAKLDPNFAMAYARMAWLYKAFDRIPEYEEAKAKALSLLNKVKEKERIAINLGIAEADQRMADRDRYGKELLEKYPNSFDAHEYLAGQYFMKREFEKANEENLKLLKIDQNHAVSYNLMAYSYYFLGEYDKALESIDKYIALAQDQANPRDSRGELLLNMGRYDEALVEFRKADSIKSDLYFVIGHIGDTYRAKGMYRDAIGAYLKAHDLSPNEKIKAMMYDNIGLCYMFSMQFDKAIEMFKEVIAKTPDDMRANALLGGIYAEQGRMDDALVQLGITKGIIANSTQQGNLNETGLAEIRVAEYYLDGAIAMAHGDYKTGVANYEKVYINTPMPDKIYFAALLGDAMLRASMPDSAVSVLTTALKDNPSSEYCLRVLANAYGKLGRKDEQIGTLLRYLTVMKDADDNLPNILNATATLAQLNRNM